MAPKTSKWGSKLKKGNKQWKKAEKRYNERFAGSQIPEDVYVFQVSLDLDENKEGDVLLKRSFTVIEGEHKGVTCSDQFNLFSEWGGAFAKKFFVTMGYEFEELSEIEEIMVEINEDEPYVKARVKQGDYTNVEVLSVLDADDVEDEGGNDDDQNDDGEDEASNDDGEGTGDDNSGDDDDGEELDLDELDKDAMLELIEEEEIDIKELGFKTKVKLKKASEEDLRAALEEYFGGDDEGEGEDSEEDDELLQEAKIFCQTQDVTIDEDADLDDVKEAIGKNKYKKADLDEEEIELLEKLELTDCIIKAKTKPKTGKKKSGKVIKKNKKK